MRRLAWARMVVLQTRVVVVDSLVARPRVVGSRVVLGRRARVRPTALSSRYRNVLEKKTGEISS